SARDGEGEGERAVVAEKRRRRVPGRNRAVAGLCSGLAIPDDPARDALRHELDPPLRTALEVEGLWQPARVERVVRDRDLGVEGSFADPSAEVAPLLEQALRPERVVGEVLEQLGERVRLEDGPVVP